MQQCFILQFRLLVHRALPRLDTTVSTSQMRAGLAFLLAAISLFTLLLHSDRARREDSN